MRGVYDRDERRDVQQRTGSKYPVLKPPSTVGDDFPVVCLGFYEKGMGVALENLVDIQSVEIT